jgi:hypothetical protein
MFGISAVLAAMDSMSYNWIIPHNLADFRRPKTRKTGKKYTHSSKRQNERFKEKWEAGKYDFTASGIPKP